MLIFDGADDADLCLQVIQVFVMAEVGFMGLNQAKKKQQIGFLRWPCFSIGQAGLDEFLFRRDDIAFPFVSG